MALFDLREVHYEAESAFCENENAAGSLTYGHRLPIKSATFSPTQERIDRETLLSRRDDSLPGVLGAKGGTLELEVYACGLGAGATGAVTQTWLGELLQKAFGGHGASKGTTLTGVGDTDTLAVTSEADWDAGDIGLLGVKADGRGDGQAFVCASTASGSLELSTGIPAAGAAQDVVYGASTVYPSPGNEATVRFLCGWATTGAQYHALGCQLESIGVVLEHGAPVVLTLRYQVATWLRSAVTIPSASPAMEACSYAPMMGGSIYVSANSTRATMAADRVALRIETGLSVIRGPSAGAYRVVTGYERTRTTPFVEITKAWATADEALYSTDGASTPTRQILITCNATAGRSVGFYLPVAYRISPIESPVSEDGRLDHTLTFRGREYAAGASDLSKSAWRFFMA